MNSQVAKSIVPADISYDEKKLELHKLDSLTLLLYTFLLTLTVVTIWLFKHRRFAGVHETGLAIIYGLIIGFIIRYAVTDDKPVTSLKVRPAKGGEFLGPPDEVILKNFKKADEDMISDYKNKSWVYEFKGEIRDAGESGIDEKTIFDPEIFFNILLPPIIFHAGYSMKKKYFFRNIGSIFAFAFLGTAISTFTVGGVMYGVTSSVESLENVTFIDNLHFGALISATDPVTVLAIFSDLNVDVNLHALVFGESVLNDAVAIVLVEALKDYEENVAECNVQQKMDDEQKMNVAGDCSYGWMHVVKAILDFLGIFAASFLVGSIMGCITALLTKFTHIRAHPMLESTLLVLMSYSTFLLAEVFELTGIVAVLFCGITQAHYTYNNLSKESQQSTKNFFDMLNFLSENFIFSYIGVSFFTFPKHHFEPIYIVASFVAILLGRALNVYPLSAILNIKRGVKITGNLQHMMMFSGLRGAIAFALAIRNTISDSRQMILSTTLTIVIVTVVINGGMVIKVLQWLNIPTGVTEEASGAEEQLVASDQSSYNTLEKGPGGGTESLTSHVNKPDKSWVARQWGGFDTQYLKPLLTHSSPTLMDTLPNRFLSLARVFTSREQIMRHPMMSRSFENNNDNSIETTEDSGSVLPS